MPSTEQTMTARELLAAYDAGRTAHMETRVIPGQFDQHRKPLTEDILVVTAEVQLAGAWRKLQQIGTDLNDEAEPVFLDVEPDGRLVLTMNHTVSVRGLAEA